MGETGLITLTDARQIQPHLWTHQKVKSISEGLIHEKTCKNWGPGVIHNDTHLFLLPFF